MNRLNFEEENHEVIDDVGDAELIMDHAMGFIWEVIIEPNKDKLSKKELDMLGVVGKALQIIANKAKAYEDMYEKGQNNSNSQN